MHYPCPERSDLDEIRALNSAFLSVFARMPATDAVSVRLATLADHELDGLSYAPFLLFSLQQDQPALWARLFAAEPDILDEPTDQDWVPITTAAIAFLWHLAKRAPHDVRLFAAGSTSWCRHLAEHRLILVTNKALLLGVRPTPRFADCPEIWDRLIAACGAPDSESPGVGRMMAMQRLLLQPAPADVELMAASRIEPVSRTLSE